MPTPSSPLLKHLRDMDPMPRRGEWVMSCSCGWKGKVATESVRSKHDALVTMERMFRTHLPEEERQTYLLVDNTPKELDDGTFGPNGVFVMPEGLRTQLARWYEDDGTRMGVLPDGRVFPVGEIRTEEGRVFKIE